MKKLQAAFSTVMLVDDNEIDNFINQKMIEGCNFADKVYVHTTAKSALEFLKNIDRNPEFPQSLVPQVIFLDINMPMMDGFQFVAEFGKLNPETRRGVKILLLTSSINPQDHQKSSNTYAIAKFMNKPLTKDHLASLGVSDNQEIIRF
ncbi:MAG: response regulator [Flavobacteriaceae bacterium]|nr:response regulator [Flavobacteriaceae bacterium]